MSPHGVKQLVTVIKNSLTKCWEGNWVCGSGISERSRADHRPEAQTNSTELMAAISLDFCLFPQLFFQYCQASRSILGLKDFKQFETIPTTITILDWSCISMSLFVHLTWLNEVHFNMIMSQISQIPHYTLKSWLNVYLYFRLSISGWVKFSFRPGLINEEF